MDDRQRILPPIRDVSTSDLQCPSPFSSSTDPNQKPDDPKLLLGSRTSFKSPRSLFGMNSRRGSTKSPFSEFVNTMSVVQCPLCADVMHMPKILPCLHNICKKCLQNYILTELRPDIQNGRSVDSFHCPVCHEQVEPGNPKLGFEKWAANFPTNFFLHAYGMILSILSGDVDCDPCFRRGETTVAAWWCCECSEYQCNVCKTVHGGFKSFKHHGVIPVKDIAKNPDLAVPRFEPCMTHREPITNYCREHKVACCSNCLASEHRRCDGIVTIDDQFEALKARGEVEEISALLKSYESIANEIKEYREKILKHAESKRKEIAETVQLIREGFERDLKQLENNLLKDLDDFHAKEVEHLTRLKRSSVNLQKRISNSLKLLETVQKFGAKPHIVITADRVTPECEKYDRELRRDQALLTNVNYTFDIDPLLADVFRNIKHFGNISVTRTDQPPQNLVVAKPVQKEKPVEMERLHVAIAGDRGRCGIIGGVYFKDGRILLADYDNFKLKLFHENGRNLGNLVLKSKPSDLAMIDETTFAVTFPSASGIQLVNMEGNRLKEGDYITTQRIYHGISHCDGKLYLVANSGIAIYNTSGNEQEFIKLHEKGASLFKAPGHIKATPNVLFVTDHGRRSVFAFSPSGKQLYTMTSENLAYPFGIDMDDYGDIFVCCKKSSTVHQFTNSGETVGVVLSEKDGVQNPLAVRFQRFYNKFFISESKGENRDYIKIFQWV